jgi:hypothetical protein
MRQRFLSSTIVHVATAWRLHSCRGFSVHTVKVYLHLLHRCQTKLNCLICTGYHTRKKSKDRKFHWIFDNMRIWFNFDNCKKVVGNRSGPNSISYSRLLETQIFAEFTVFLLNKWAHYLSLLSATRSYLCASIGFRK